MSRTGRGVAWSVILVSALFIVAYLLSAEERTGIGQERSASPDVSAAPAAESDEGAAAGSELAPEEAAEELMSAEEAPEAGGATVDPGEAPRIELDATTWDFGEMYQEEKVSYEFVYRNVGKGPLRIEKVKTDCGCTAAQPSHREILPGQRGTLSATFDSGHYRDSITKHIYVDTNDPETPRVTLTVTGVIKMDVQVTPIGIYVGQMKLGAKAIRSVDIIAVDVSRFKVVGTRITDPAIKVLRTESIKKGGKRGYRLVVQYGPVTKPGRVSGDLLVQTDLKHSRSIPIRVYGRVLPAEGENEPKPEA